MHLQLRFQEDLCKKNYSINLITLNTTPFLPKIAGGLLAKEGGAVKLLEVVATVLDSGELKEKGGCVVSTVENLWKKQTNF